MKAQPLGKFLSFWQDRRHGGTQLAVYSSYGEKIDRSAFRSSKSLCASQISSSSDGRNSSSAMDPACIRQFLVLDWHTPQTRQFEEIIVACKSWYAEMMIAMVGMVFGVCCNCVWGLPNCYNTLEMFLGWICARKVKLDRDKHFIYAHLCGG